MPRRPDIQERFAAHIKASQECERWSTEAVRLDAAGKKREAARAKAKECMRRMTQLEGKP